LHHDAKLLEIVQANALVRLALGLGQRWQQHGG
jgi:hypothetical protein